MGMVIFNQWNKACFSLFYILLYVIKVIVHGLICCITLWRHLGNWETTQKSRVGHGYCLALPAVQSEICVNCALAKLIKLLIGSPDYKVCHEQFDAGNTFCLVWYNVGC